MMVQMHRFPTMEEATDFAATHDCYEPPGKKCKICDEYRMDGSHAGYWAVYEILPSKALSE
jgi:hypothetical protein